MKYLKIDQFSCPQRLTEMVLIVFALAVKQIIKRFVEFGLYNQRKQVINL